MVDALILIWKKIQVLFISQSYIEKVTEG